MGEKSLLSLLEEEKNLVNEIRFRKSDMQRVLGEMEVYPHMRTAAEKYCKDAEIKIREMEEELHAVRGNMRKYIKSIMEAG